MTETQKSLEQIKTRYDVAKLLSIEESSLRYFLYGLKLNNVYYEFSIKKKNGSTRTISVPDKRINNLQKKILRVLEEYYYPKPSVYGFVKGKNCVDNAANHVKKRWVLNIDLKDFFGQVHFGRVRGALMSSPFCIGEEAAMVMAQIICYKGILPQGGSTSPIITNIVCRSLDNELLSFAKKHHLYYSRYADDITFSTSLKEFPQSVAYKKGNKTYISQDLQNIIEKNSFFINDEKINLNSDKDRQEVTGLVVNRFVNVKRSYLKELRAMLYSSKEYGLYESAKKYVLHSRNCNSYIYNLIQKSEIDEEEKEIVEAWYLKVLRGKVDYLKSVRGSFNPYFIKYATEYNDLCGKVEFPIDDKRNTIDKLYRYVFVIEGQCGENVIQGTGFIVRGLGLVTNYHVVDCEDVFFSVRDVNQKEVNRISLNMNCKHYDRILDYAVFNGFDVADGLEISDKLEIVVGQEVSVVGYPEYVKGDTLSYISTRVSAKKKKYQTQVCLVSNAIYHGTSGGPVLDMQGKVVGLVKCGPSSTREDDEYMLSGFIPMSNVIADLDRNVPEEVEKWRGSQN